MFRVQRGGDRLQKWGRVERTPRWQMSEQACEVKLEYWKRSTMHNL